MSAEADLLKEVPLFHLLDEHERTELAAQLDVVHFAAMGRRCAARAMR